MFFIFGWGRTTTKQHGAFSKMHCTHCHNERYWELYSQTKWFTFFFIPVIPYSFNYFLLCPVCQHGLTLDKSTFTDLKQRRGIYTEYLKAFKQRSIANAETFASNHRSAEKPKAPQYPVGTVSDDKNSDNQKTAHFHDHHTDRVTCPICGSVQLSDRKNCFRCGCKFVFDNEAPAYSS